MFVGERYLILTHSLFPKNILKNGAWNIHGEVVLCLCYLGTNDHGKNPNINQPTNGDKGSRVLEMSRIV